MRAYWPGWGAWAIGTPLGVSLGLIMWLGLALWAPARFVMLADSFLRPLGHRMVVDHIQLEMPEGLGHPGAWLWRVDGFAFLGRAPKAPVVFVDHATIDLPRLTWGDDGLLVQIPRVHVDTFELFFPYTERPEAWRETHPLIHKLVAKDVVVDRFALTMGAHEKKPEVFVDAVGVHGMEIAFQPGPRLLTGLVQLEEGEVEVAGVAFDDVHTDVVVFTGTGLETQATARLGRLSVEAGLVVDPLFRPPDVRVEGTVRDGTLHDLADALLGRGVVAVTGGLTVRGYVEAGDSVGPGHMRGQASVTVNDARLTLPDEVKGMILTAIRIAPFITLDDRTIVFGDLRGRVSYTERGVDLDDVTYEAPHSDASIAGYVRSHGASARMYFHPRPGEGAVPWGLVVRGALDDLKVGMALPGVLEAWTPCEDPLDCPLRGGSPTGSDD